MFKNQNTSSINKVGKPKTSTQQVEFQIAIIYNQISTMIQEKGDLQIQLPSDIPTAVQRLNLIKSVVGYLLEERNDKKTMICLNQSNVNQNQQGFDCKDCSVYEQNLQKVEGQVRNHIRTNQQLKLFQDSLEQKIEENKKQKVEMEKKIKSLEKKYEEVKAIVNISSEKAGKLQLQNEKLKQDLKGKGKYQDRKLNRYESNKQNFGQWNHKGGNSKRERNSVQKRPESGEKMRLSVNVRSSKGIPLTSKLMVEKVKDEKIKAIKSRIGYGL